MIYLYLKPSFLQWRVDYKIHDFLVGPESLSLILILLFQISIEFCLFFRSFSIEKGDFVFIRKITGNGRLYKVVRFDDSEKNKRIFVWNYGKFYERLKKRFAKVHLLFNVSKPNKREVFYLFKNQLVSLAFWRLTSFINHHLLYYLLTILFIDPSSFLPSL